MYQLTTLSEEVIEETVKNHMEEPHRRFAQGKLAETVTEALHGQVSLHRAKLASSILFGETEQTFEDLSEGIQALTETGSVPELELPAAAVCSLTVADVVVRLKICQSKGECRRLVSSGGLYVNTCRVDDANSKLSSWTERLPDTPFILIRKGKKNYYVVKLC